MDGVIIVALIVVVLAVVLVIATNQKDNVTW